jgi:hypothetical protein
LELFPFCCFFTLEIIESAHKFANILVVLLVKLGPAKDKVQVIRICLAFRHPTFCCSSEVAALKMNKKENSPALDQDLNPSYCAL